MALSAGGRPVHPSVGHLRRTYQTAENLYFVLNYAGAVSLRDVMTRLSCAGLRLSLGAARLWAGEAAAALAAMRPRGVLHRDIRPENLIVNEEGHLTLVDFDAALRIDTQQQQQPQQQQQQQQEGEYQQQKEGLLDQHKRAQHARTKPLQRVSSSSSRSSGSGGGCSWESASGSLVDGLQAYGWLLTQVLSPYAGTPAYAAPELFVSLDPDGEETAQQQFGCGFGTDCWSFGCLVHELLLGEPPFKGDSPAALAMAVCGVQEVSLPQQLPAAAADLITRLLRPKEEERLGARDIKEILQHPFFDGLDCTSLHYQPLPIDVTQYAFAFGGLKQSRRAAAATSAATGGNAAPICPGDAEAGGGEAEAAAAAAAAAMEAELTPSIGCRFSPLKTAASEAPRACPSCGSSKVCVCASGVADAFPLSPSGSYSGNKSRETPTTEGPPSRYEWGHSNSDVSTEVQKVAMQQQLLLLQQRHSELSPQQLEATEEPRASCRCAVTEAVLGWGPPLRLRPLSTADYSEDAAAAEAAAEAAAAGSVAAGDREESGGLSVMSSSTPLAGCGVASSGRRAGSFRGPQQGPPNDPVTPLDDPPFASRWLLKGERVRYHGVLFRLRGEALSLLLGCWCCCTRLVNAINPK